MAGVRKAPIGRDPALPDADFDDAYAIDWPGPVDARLLGRLALDPTPDWMMRLLALRNVMVRPFGLAGTIERVVPNAETLGPFPVISEDPNRMVLGFDDHHLDFRIVLRVCQGSALAATLVRHNNALGRAYLMAILPFHRLIVPALLRHGRARLDRHLTGQSGPD